MKIVSRIRGVVHAVNQAVLGIGVEISLSLAFVAVGLGIAYIWWVVFNR